LDIYRECGEFIFTRGHDGKSNPGMDWKLDGIREDISTNIPVIEPNCAIGKTAEQYKKEMGE
jgi:hypothetical protein